MSLYDQFEGNEDVLMPRREYTDIVRQDSSVELRNRFRSFWGLGEQLWDVDYNNNLVMLTRWMGVDLVNWRLPKAPWNLNPATQKRIARSGTFEDLIEYSGSGDSTYFVPFAGATVYSKADRLVLTYTGTAWKPVCRLPIHRPAIEIAMFASYPKTGEVCARHIATTPFKLLSPGGDDSYSRIRSNRPCIVQIFKNGVYCGLAQLTMSPTQMSAFNYTDQEVSFAVGDELSVRAPSPLMGVTWLSVSFLGKVIEA